MNTFGLALRITTFGESHGAGIGGVIDGLPAGIVIDEELLQAEMLRRSGGKNLYSTQRKEADAVEILSGVFAGKTTGTPLGFFIKNSASKSGDYDSIKDLFRPGHADFTYFQKYHIRDYRGGGRSSARESAVRVAAGAIAKMLLRNFDIKIQSGILSIGTIEAEDIDFNHARESEIFALDCKKETMQKEAIMQARNTHNSIGGVALIEANGIPAGLGEPLYYKLDSAIGALMLGLNGVKAVEIGEGVQSTHLLGSENNDEMDTQGFLSNHCGGVLGGISTGNALRVKVHFKPTPSIFLPQRTQDIQGNTVECKIKGRHDPCIAVRGSVVCEAQLAFILADMLLLNASSTLENLKKLYC